MALRFGLLPLRWSRGSSQVFIVSPGDTAILPGWNPRPITESTPSIPSASFVARDRNLNSGGTLFFWRVNGGCRWAVEAV